MTKITKWMAGILLLMVVPAANADMGQIHTSDVTVSEEAQKAIILHNLEEEILILGTDLLAEKETGIIRFIPFPSEPAVELAAGDPFQAMVALVGKYRLAHVFQSKGPGTTVQGIEIGFNKKLGAHDVTVMKINDAKAFREWVNGYFKSKGLPTKEAYPEIEAVAEDYVGRGIVWFVFDFVELTDQVRFIEPLMYRFQSPEFYYPLKTSNTFGGEGEIDIFLLAPRSACEPLGYNLSGCLGLERLSASTSEKITPADAGTVFPKAGEFFAGQNIYLQSFQYFGPYRFDQDLMFDLRKGVDQAYSVDNYQNVGPDPFEELQRQQQYKQ